MFHRSNKVFRTWTFQSPDGGPDIFLIALTQSCCWSSLVSTQGNPALLLPRPRLQSSMGHATATCHQCGYSQSKPRADMCEAVFHGYPHPTIILISSLTICCVPQSSGWVPRADAGLHSEPFCSPDSEESVPLTLLSLE